MPIWAYDVGLLIEQQALKAEHAFAARCSNHVKPTAKLAMIAQCIINNVLQGDSASLLSRPHN